MSVSEIGKIPTRVFEYGEGRKRTVKLTADLRCRIQDIRSLSTSGQIGSGEVMRRVCIAIFGQRFWDGIPFDMIVGPVEDFATDIMREVLGIAKPEEDDGDADADDNESAEPDAPEPDPKNEDTPPSEG